jgi:flagellar biosynthesis/type III secretory pathway ATPase
LLKKNRPALRGDREMRYEEKIKRNKSETVIVHFKEESKFLLKMKPQNVIKREIKIIYKTQQLYFVNSDTRYVGQPTHTISQYLRRKQKSNATSTQSWSVVVHKHFIHPTKYIHNKKNRIECSVTKGLFLPHTVIKYGHND